MSFTLTIRGKHDRGSRSSTQEHTIRWTYFAPNLRYTSEETLAQETVTAEEAKALITPLYEALAASSPDKVATLLSSVTSPQWQSCGGNETCLPRDAIIASVIRRVSVFPDMKFVPREVLVSGNRIVVRGANSGTPSGVFLGIAPRGKSFRVMTIDIHSVEDGRIVKSYHVEDWLGATRQLGE